MSINWNSEREGGERVEGRALESERATGKERERLIKEGWGGRGREAGGGRRGWSYYVGTRYACEPV